MKALAATLLLAAASAGCRTPGLDDGGTGGGGAGGVEIDLVVGAAAATPGRLISQGRLFSGTIWIHPMIAKAVFTDRLVAPPHRLGAVRYSLQQIAETPGLSRATFAAALPQLLASPQDFDFVDRWRAAGGTVIFDFFSTPDWLAVGPRAAAPCADEARFRPPADLQVWRDEVVAPITTALVARFGAGQHYEVWNEPTTCSWLGTTDEYLQLYAATAAGIREVDPTARVGGPSHNGTVTANATMLDRPDGGELPFVQRLITFAATHAGGRLPLDFVSLHTFRTTPNPNAAYHEDQVTTVRDWLADAGYPPTTELICDEWNYDAYYARDGGAPVANFSYIDAVYTAQTLMAFDRAGYEQQAAQALVDTGPSVGSMTLSSPHPFPRPGYAVFELFSELSGTQLEVESAHPWVRATAFRAGQEVSVVAASFPDRDQWTLSVGLKHLLQVDPTVSPVLQAQPAVAQALAQFLAGPSAALPGQLTAAFTASQQAAISAGKAVVDDGRARRARWGVTGEALDALADPGRKVAWRVTLATAVAPTRVLHRAMDATHTVDEAKLLQLVGPMKDVARASVCAADRRLIQASATPALSCPALDTYCATGNALGLLQPPLTTCTGLEVFALEFTDTLGVGRAEQFLTGQLQWTSQQTETLRAEHALALADYAAGWEQMWLGPALQQFEEDVTAAVQFSGGQASVVVAADPYSVHRLKFTLP